jgi:hypothetical protein
MRIAAFLRDGLSGATGDYHRKGAIHQNFRRSSERRPGQYR